MQPTQTYHHLSLFYQLRSNQSKGLAVLIDPDKAHTAHLQRLVPLAEKAGAFCFFVGGSLLSTQQLDETLQAIKSMSDLPLILFPGSSQQVSSKADGILFLSLVSGRNPEFLIGSHVVAAPAIKAAAIEPLPTAYLLIDGGAPTTASYISNTQPIPANKPDIAACTAMASEMLGMRLIYLDTGSGAPHPVSSKVLHSVRTSCNLPIIVGGGIKTASNASKAWDAGADVIVVGNALEENPEFALELGEALKNQASKSHLV